MLVHVHLREMSMPQKLDSLSRVRCHLPRSVAWSGEKHSAINVQYLSMPSSHIKLSDAGLAAGMPRRKRVEASQTPSISTIWQTLIGVTCILAMR